MSRSRSLSLAYAPLAVVLCTGSVRAQVLLHEFQGAQSGDKFGASIAGIGDLDGDGYREFVIGASESDVAFPYAGTATVHSGKTGSVLAEFHGNQQFARMGMSAAGVGDWNHDGVPDFALGAPFASFSGVASGGGVYVVSGADFSILFSYYPGGSHQLGDTMAGLGDFDGDGHVEFVATQVGGQGKAFVFSSAPNFVKYTFPASAFSSSISAAGRIGDLNGDGITEIAVCEGIYSSLKGLMKIYSGADGSLFRTHVGPVAGMQFGTSFTRLGDVDGDGVGDYAVGAERDSSLFDNGGSVTVFSGAAGNLIHTLYGTSTGAFFGKSLCAMDDPNGDGFDDLLVGSISSWNAFSGADWSILESGGKGQLVTKLGDINNDGRTDFGFGYPLNSGSAKILSGAAAAFMGEPYCPGIACPCGNDPQPGVSCPKGSKCGCVNSTSQASALLALGTTSLATDDLTFFCGYVPQGSVAILLAGTQSAGGGSGLPFGDGLLCVGGTVNRVAVGEVGTFSAKFGPGLAAAGAWSAGDTRYFQAWYRDASGSPCGKDFNLSSGVKLTFLP